MDDDTGSDYESFCQKNIAERNALLKSIFTNIKDDSKEINNLENKRQELDLKEKKLQINSKKVIKNNASKDNNPLISKIQPARSCKQKVNYSSFSKTQDDSTKTARSTTRSRKINSPLIFKKLPTRDCKQKVNYFSSSESSGSDSNDSLSDILDDSSVNSSDKSTTDSSVLSVSKNSANKRINKISKIAEAFDDTNESQMAEPVQKKNKLSNLLNEIDSQRKKTAENVLQFKYNKKRVRVLSKADEIVPKSKGIVYWMFRDSRVQDNWALLYAQKLALKNKIPLHVCFFMLPEFLDATIRHFSFLIGGLQEVEKDLLNLNINFHLIKGEPTELLIDFIKKNQIGALVCDFFPLRIHLSWVNDILKKLPKKIPFCQVDAHNIVPCWVASDKLEYAARTIRNKINSKLSEFLTEFPPLIKHPYKSDLQYEKTDWSTALEKTNVDRTVENVSWVLPGYQNGITELESFINERLKLYHGKRNNPNINALSNLSPWFHFGMISVQRCILEVAKYKSKYKESVEAYMEEAIVRRELSDNFCFYNSNYDSIKGAANWAQETLNNHCDDKREYLYKLEELENSKTHDDLWNAAQIQLVKEGKMHGFLRMYWAKKILEWTKTPEEALKWSIYLNDKYSLDGTDPSGYVGCMWSICGIHDQAWRERAIFGKIRYMNYNGCLRKFDVPEFVRKYNAKVFNNKAN